MTTYAEAKEKGYKFFTPDTPCPRGHLSIRYTRTRACKECNIEREKVVSARRKSITKSINSVFKAPLFNNRKNLKSL